MARARSIVKLSVDHRARLVAQNEDYIRDPRGGSKLAVLRERLLSRGGEEVVLVFEEDVDRLLKRGVFQEGRAARLMRGDPGRCHANAANLWESNRTDFPGRVKIYTGWALTASDGLWWQHSWVYDSPFKKVVETTEPRVRYFGFELTDREAQRFADDNL